MLAAMIELQQMHVEPTISTDEIEEVDVEEIGFQATYARLAVAGLALEEYVPYPSVDEAVKNFVTKLAAADGLVGGALFARIRSEIPPKSKAILAGWGVAI